MSILGYASESISDREMHLIPNQTLALKQFLSLISRSASIDIHRPLLSEFPANIYDLEVSWINVDMLSRSMPSEKVKRGLVETKLSVLLGEERRLEQTFQSTKPHRKKYSESLYEITGNY